MGKQWKHCQTLFWGFKITADDDCSHEIKRHLLLGRKVLTNLDSILKSRDIILPLKVHLVKAMVFPVVTYGCESWTIKKAEGQRTDAFELWCWRRLLRVPWTARRSNQFILKEISPDYSLKGLMLKLKLQYFGHLMWRTDWEKTLMLGKIESRRRRGRQRMRWLDGITDSTWVWVNPESWRWTGRPGVLQSIGLQKVEHDWATELYWTVCGSSSWVMTELCSQFSLLVSLQNFFSLCWQNVALTWYKFTYPEPSSSLSIRLTEAEMKIKVAQSCQTLRDPMDCSLPGSSIHGIFQTRVLEWGATAFSA